MKLVSEHNKVSLAECRKAASKGNIKYTDEQLLKMRDWFMNMADISLEYLEKNGMDCLDELIATTKTKNKGKPKK
jgi:hypothetical protein